MTVKTYTKIQGLGIAEWHPQKGMMEHGYGLYVNAYVVDTEFDMPELEADASMGMYATERVPFDASAATISKARKRARERARARYIREKESV